MNTILKNNYSIRIIKTQKLMLGESSLINKFYKNLLITSATHKMNNNQS